MSKHKQVYLHMCSFQAFPSIERSQVLLTSYSVFGGHFVPTYELVIPLPTFIPINKDGLNSVLA